jgi:hypothetical protein
MAKVKKHGDGPSKPVSFRLSEVDFLAYQAKCAEAGLTSSEFFRECVLTNRTQIMARPKATADTKRLLYLVNKAGNNLNQLAYRANSDHLAGMLSESTYEGILYNLELIARYLKAGIRHAD